MFYDNEELFLMTAEESKSVLKMLPERPNFSVLSYFYDGLSNLTRLSPSKLAEIENLPVNEQEEALNVYRYECIKKPYESHTGWEFSYDDYLSDLKEAQELSI